MTYGNRREEKLKTRKELEKDHPLNRKFSSIDEASKAKADYLFGDKPASFWEELEKITRR